MAFCSFSSLVGEMCGPSPENPNVVRLLDLKNCARDVKAHLKFCNILMNVESVNSERKLLLARAIFLAQECHMTVCPKHRDAYG
ncbi:hypothetical protein P5673_030507, partial [Acropora cervicornis]